MYRHLAYLSMVHIVQQGPDLVEPNILERKYFFRYSVSGLDWLFCSSWIENPEKGKSHLKEDDRVFAGVLHEKALEVVGTGGQNLNSKDNLEILCQESIAILPISIGCFLPFCGIWWRPRPQPAWHRKMPQPVKCRKLLRSFVSLCN